MRGDVFRLRAPRDVPSHEQSGRRYAVIVQSGLLPLSTWLAAPTSTSARPARFRPEIELDGRPALVLAEQTTAIDPSRLGAAVGHVTAGELRRIEAALRLVMDL